MPDPAARPTPAPGPAAALDDTCPRCGGRFHCGAADPGPCACSTLVLSAELQAQLRRQYSGCLCVTCLAELAAHGGTD